MNDYLVAYSFTAKDELGDRISGDAHTIATTEAMTKETLCELKQHLEARLATEISCKSPNVVFVSIFKLDKVSSEDKS